MVVFSGLGQEIDLGTLGVKRQNGIWASFSNLDFL